jgi:sialic acid synthase SpsE
VGRLASRYPYSTIGYSDHSLDVFAAPLAAKGFGATVIEKHFKLDHIVGTPDAPHSLGPSDFQLMAKALKGAPPMGPAAFQNDAVKRYRRRLLASRPVAAGEMLTYGENFGFYRSKVDDLEGGAFWDHKQVTGKAARKSYQHGDAINPKDYQ